MNTFSMPPDDSMRKFIPHRPPMVLVTNFVRVDEEGAVVLASAGSHSLFIRPDATVEPLALLEAIAQACASYGGWLSSGEGMAGKTAFLVGVKSFEAPRTVKADTVMEIRVTLTHRFSGFYLFEGELTQQGQLVAKASIKAFHPEGASPEA